MALTRLVAGLSVVCAAALVVPGCGLVGELLELHGPFKVFVEVSGGVEPALVRAALFNADTEVEVEHDDGTMETLEVSLEAVKGGQIVLQRELALPHDVALEPLQVADGATGEVTFRLPKSSEDVQLIAAAWVDEDGDGKLGVRADGSMERAFGPTIEVDMIPYFLATYLYDASADSYSAIAEFQDNEVLIVEDRHRDDFRIDVE